MKVLIFIIGIFSSICLTVEENWQLNYEVIILGDISSCSRYIYNINPDSIFVFKECIRNDEFVEEEIYRNTTVNADSYKFHINSMNKYDTLCDTNIIGGRIKRITINQNKTIVLVNIQPKELSSLDSLINLSISDSDLKIK